MWQGSQEPGSRRRALCVGIMMSLPVKSELGFPRALPGGVHTLHPQLGAGKESVDGLRLKEGRSARCLPGTLGTRVSTGQWQLPRLLDRRAGAGGSSPCCQCPGKPFPLAVWCEWARKLGDPTCHQNLPDVPPVSSPRRTAGSLRLPLCWMNRLSLSALHTHTLNVRLGI